QGVSENADTSRKVGEDVNAIVRKVTEVLRGGDGLMSVEERLDKMMWSLMAMWLIIIREALEVLRNMKNKDIVIEHDHFQTLLNGMCHADRMADALEIVDILKRKYAVDKNIYGMHVFTILGFWKSW
ncbi:putative pentatricopeptide repeat-containing protein, partial [Tanacetum coccineum]